MKPSTVLQFDRYFGTYDRAVAWLVVHGNGSFAFDDTEVVLIADLYGKEPARVVSDIQQAQKRERSRPRRSIARVRLSLHKEK